MSPLADVYKRQSQAQDQHGTRVWMADKPLEKALRAQMVLSKLAAPHVVWKSVDPLHTVSERFPRLLFQNLRGTVDAPNRRDDPHLVSHAGTAVLARIPLEGRLQAGAKFRRRRPVRTVAVVDDPFQIGFEIVRVNMRTLGNIHGGMPDHMSVFEDGMQKANSTICISLHQNRRISTGTVSYTHLKEKS